MLVLFGVGETSTVLLFLLGLFFGCFVATAVVVPAWVLVARQFTTHRVAAAAATTSLALGTVGALFYEALCHRDLFGAPMLAAALGAFVVTNATLVVIMLMRAERQSAASKFPRPRVRIRTLLAIMVVVAVILATIVPTIRAF